MLRQHANFSSDADADPIRGTTVRCEHNAVTGKYKTLLGVFNIYRVSLHLYFHMVIEEIVEGEIMLQSSVILVAVVDMVINEMDCKNVLMIIFELVGLRC